MQTLDFPIRILERENGDVCILVSHEDQVYYKNEANREKANHTRAFCNWVRKQFPHVPTEFRFVNTKSVSIRSRSIWGYGIPRSRTVNCDKHFVAYDLTKSELMLIKLAWQFQTQPVRLATTPPIENSFTINAFGGLRPTDALKKRIENKTRAKLLSTD